MNIYVGNLSRSVTEEALRGVFEEFGQVSSVRIIKDRFTGNPRGFAFVEMPSGDEAQDAINNLNGRDIEGRPVTVNEARPQEQRAGGGMQRGGGRPGGDMGPRSYGPRRPGGGGTGGGWGGNRGGW